MEATVNGERLAWDGIGRFELRDGRVFDAIGRWDTAAIQAALGASPAAGSAATVGEDDEAP